LLQILNNSNSSLIKNIIINHFIVLIIFSILTIAYFPFFVDPDIFQDGGWGDNASNIHTIWWFHYSIFELEETPFQTHGYSRHPLNDQVIIPNLTNAFLSIPLRFFLLSTDIYLLQLFSAFVLTGYGTFQLSKYLTKNYFASIIGGIIVAFSFYMTWHSFGHLPLITFFWIPIFFWVLFKTRDSNKISYILVSAALLILGFFSQWYLGIFFVLFAIVFVIPLLIMTKNRWIFLKKLLLIFGIFLIISIPIFNYSTQSAIENIESSSLVYPKSNQIALSVDLTNYVRMPPNAIISGADFYSRPADGPETWAFPTFTAIFFGLYSIIKIDKKKTAPWLISGSILFLVSLGPMLKVMGIWTGIPLLVYLFEEISPLFDFLRALGRASIFVTFSLAILSTFAITHLMTRFSYKQGLMLFLLITAIVIIETYPIESKVFSLPNPQFYSDIKNDVGNKAVLDVPLGGYGTFLYGDDYLFSYYQTIHEKPTFALTLGSRPDPHTILHPYQYFLNSFTMIEDDTDIVNQDLKEVGLSLFDHFNIGYVVLHKQPHAKYGQTYYEPFVERSKILLDEILNKEPDYEDTEIIGYRIPTQSNEIPFLILNSNWGPVNKIRDITYRSIDDAEFFTIVNPSNNTKFINLEIEISPLNDGVVQITQDNKKSTKLDLNKAITYSVQWHGMELDPGINQIKLVTKSNPSNFPEQLSLGYIYVNYEVSLLVSAIDITIVDSSVDQSVNFSAKPPTDFNLKIVVYEEINNVFNRLLERNPTQKELDVISNGMLYHGLSVDWLSEKLITSEEYKIKYSLSGN